jgi:hypothetical protein
MVFPAQDLAAGDFRAAFFLVLAAPAIPLVLALAAALLCG